MARKKSDPAAPELEAMIDTIEDATNPDETKPAARVRRQKPGPKKVRDETTKIVGDGIAVGVMLSTSQADARKNLTMEEAQSIGHPVARMLGRRIPGWLKPLLPKTKLNPDDAADIEEILATIGKWGVRLMTLMVADFVESREKAKADHQQEKAVSNRQADPAVARPAASPNEQVSAAPTSNGNGHNPAFDILNSVDLGIEI